MNNFKFMARRMSLAIPQFQTEILPVSKSAIHFDQNDKLTISDSSTKSNLEKAAKILSSSDQVVAFPTETVYGLGGSSFNDESIKNIYKAKNRPADNPLITHISSKSQIKSFFNIDIPEIYLPLIEKFWPGPLTILLPIDQSNTRLSKLTTANQPTFAVRLPSHPIARALIHLSQVPIAAPSANASTRPSPTMASHVFHDLNGKIPLILDGGPSNVGVESTVVDGLSDPPMLLRPGGVSLEEIVRVGGQKWANIRVAKRVADENEPVKTPGMKYKHYSPTAKVILVESDESKIGKFIEHNGLQQKKMAFLTCQSFKGEDFNGIVENLGKEKEEISANLFNYLRNIDEMGVDLIFVETVDEKDEGLAIMNRLKKAASETI